MTELKTNERSRGPRTPGISLSLRTLADSAEVAGTMVTERECLSKGKKRKYRGSFSGKIPTRESEPDSSGSKESRG